MSDMNALLRAGNAIPLGVDVVPLNPLVADPTKLPLAIQNIRQSQASTQNMLNQNRLFQQEIGAKEAMPTLLRQSIGASGELDHTKLLQAMANDPRAAFKYPEVAKALQELANQRLIMRGHELENIHKELGNAKARVEQIAGSTSALLSLPDEKLNHLTVQKHILDQYELGSFGDPQSQQAKSAVVSLLAQIRPDMTSSQLRNKVKGFQGQILAAKDRIEMYEGKMGWKDVGGAEVLMKEPGVLSPDKTPVAQGQVPKTATPEQSNVLVEQPNLATGQMEKVNRGSLGMTPGQTLPGVPVIGASPSATVGGNVNIPQFPVVDVKAREKIGTEFGEKIASFPKDAEAAWIQKTAINHMRDALTKTFETGPTADWKAFVAKTWNQYVPDFMKIDESKVTNFEEFQKLAYQQAMQGYRAMGGSAQGMNSNMELQTLLGSNPGPLMSTKGNQLILALLEGNADLMLARNKAWNEWEKTNGPSPSSYARFTEEFTSRVDPRVFQVQYVDDEVFNHMKSNMTAKQWDKFAKSVDYVSGKGWVE